MSRLLPLLAADDPGFVASRYMPAFKVEIAFTSGYNTAAADRVWTDVSDYVELADGISVDHGRQDERSTADANGLTLTLDNTDGRFTAGRSASPYYPNVKVGRPVRVSALTVTGYTSVRFVGFIDEWPVEWDGTDAYAKASVRATSRLARLGLSTKLRSAVEAEILADSPSLYWTMGDPSGSVSAADSSGNGGPPLAIAGSGSGTIEFGNATGPGTDGLTAASMAASGAERFLAASMPLGTTAASFGAGCFFATTASVGQLLLGHPTDDYGSALGLITLLSDGKIEAQRGTASVTTATSYNDGNVHHAFVTYASGTMTLFVDGASVGSDTGAGSETFSTFRVGQQFIGSIAHVELYAGTSPAVPTAGRIAAHADAGLNGFAGDLTDERLERILGWAGVPASEVTADVGSETMTYQQTSGQSVVDALRDVESTEGGVLFDGLDGSVVFHNRSRRYTATPAATLDMAAQHVGADYAPKLDRTTLANIAEVDNPTTGETARYVDTTSIDEYGEATTSAKCVVTTSDPLLQKAAWLVFSYAEPRPRVPSLTVDVLAHVGATPSAETLLGLGVGDLIEVVNQPTQADATTAKYFIEGYTENIGPESYSITFNLSPSHPHLSVVVLDDPDRGLDSGSILAL